MLVKILRTFPYAHNFVTVKSMIVGEIEEIRDELIEGLEKAGLVSTSLKAQPAAATSAGDDAASAGDDPAGGAEGGEGSAEGAEGQSSGDDAGAPKAAKK